ncbi:MAG: cellulase family glycosylhydrolase [Pirellulales bacterium]|nr:cellulase family glycosylhydrolase [Pirellulales bacterium]
MRLFLAVITFLGLSAGVFAEDAPSTDTANSGRWSVERAKRWYAEQAWPCGLNYIPANSISYTEMWMPYCFDADFIDTELALAEEIGFNCVRVVLPFVVWEHDPKAFKKRFNKFLEICDLRGIKVMPVLFDDCAFGNDQKLKNPWYGKQPEVLKGWYANGWTPSPGHDMVRDPKSWPRLERYVKDLISTYRNDKRVWVWDLYNEPTNGGLGKVSLPLARKVFAWAREVNPSQPLTVAAWNRNQELNAMIFANSDIITFHNYSGPDRLAEHIRELKKQGRPIINTEWLNRIGGSVPKTCLPVFRRENVGCMHWGLVNGKTQTNLGWGWRPGRPDPPVWQHDLFHGDHKPYDPKEIELFRTVIRSSRD